MAYLLVFIGSLLLEIGLKEQSGNMLGLFIICCGLVYAIRNNKK
jgi:hypothetical protein